MITNFKIFEANIIYPFTSYGDGEETVYNFTNQYGTEYKVTFQDYLLTYSTSKKLEQTNEHDVYNILNTVTKIIVDFLENNDYPIYMNNIPSDKEIEKYKTLDNQRKHKTIRTKLMSKFLDKNLPEDYTYTTSEDDVNLMVVHLKNEEPFNDN